MTDSAPTATDGGPNTTAVIPGRPSPEPVAVKPKRSRPSRAKAPADAPPVDSPTVVEDVGPPAPEAPSEPEKPSEGVKFTPRELYDEVEKIRGQQAGISNKDVFALLARRTGRSEGSISQTYYNVVRKASNQGQRRAGPPLKARGDSLSAQVAAMERELLDLRAFKARVESIVGN